MQGEGRVTSGSSCRSLVLSERSSVSLRGCNDFLFWNKTHAQLLHFAPLLRENTRMSVDKNTVSIYRDVLLLSNSHILYETAETVSTLFKLELNMQYSVNSINLEQLGFL